MNDPYVVALNYRIEHCSSVGYDNAAPLDHSEEAFDIHVEGKKVRFVMKRHYATEAKAVGAVKDYIRAWERLAALQNGPNEFTLVFAGAEIKDREPTPGIKYGSARFVSGTPSFNIAGRVLKAAYPQPPSRRLEFSPDIDSMHHRYLGYRAGREPLPSMAYFCLTMLQYMAGGNLSAAAKEFGISHNALTKANKLSGGAGGGAARKADGIHRPYGPDDKRFLDAAIRSMIIRAAEVAHSPDAKREQITIDGIKLNAGIV
ncbi:MAG: hypothetical protein OXD36_15325 [Rhodobacter sp.]|nr:hypothetical protein [Rhodobacter sp.]